jgi:hypothetical protein
MAIIKCLKVSSYKKTVVFAAAAIIIMWLLTQHINNKELN